MLVNQGNQNYYDIDEDGNVTRQLRAQEEPKLLPFPIEDLNQKQCWPWLRTEIEKEHIRNGGKLNRIVWGDPRFKPSFWIDTHLPWSSGRGKPVCGWRHPGFAVHLLEHSAALDQLAPGKWT